MKPPIDKLHPIGLGLVFPSLLVGFDLFTTQFCERIPLAWYLAACGAGVVLGGVLGRKPANNRRILWACGALILLGGIGATCLTLNPPSENNASALTPSWNSHCAHRYCSRALGPRLDRSPFPVGIPSCHTLHMCIEEASHDEDQKQQWLTLLRNQGCEQP
jgi:hypothetical protein